MIALLIIIPIASALAILMLGQHAKRIAVGACIANFGIALLAALAYGAGDGMDAFNSSDWAFKPIAAVDFDSIKIHLHFGLSGISVVMMLLTAIVSLAAVFSGKAPKEHEKMWFISTLLIAAGGMGAFLSRDLFFFYAFHELALIPTFLMIGILGRGDRRYIAWKATIYLAAGSIVLLAGLAWLANIAGTFDLASLQQNILTKLGESGEARSLIETQLCWVACLMFLGYGTLVSLFPFHSWAAPAYASAPAPVAMLHAGVLKKFGLYGLLVTCLGVIPNSILSAWMIPLIVLLLFNIIWVGLITVNQKRMDLMFGNSSVMHMGYIFLAIAAFIAIEDNKLAIPAATLLMFAHGVSIAMSFSLTDLIERKTKTLEFNQLGGLAKTAPKICFFFGLVGMASIGLPGLANFAGEVMVFFSGFQDWDASKGLGAIQWATIIALWGVVISAVYMLRAIKNTFHGDLSPTGEGITDIALREQLPALLLGATLILVGFFPKILLQFLN